VSVWSGWQNQFLNAANIIVTPPNRQLLDQWARNATTSCARNPIDLSHAVGNSSNCASLPGIFPHAKRYATHASAATAFRDEIHMSFAKALLDAMNTGNPYQIADPSAVTSVFVSWGSDSMANIYAAATSGGGSGGGGGAATGLHQGWSDLTRSLSNRRLGDKIRMTNQFDAATLRALKRARKVRLK
jgi:hypothetical protein